jgi:hypothetical protein
VAAVVKAIYLLALICATIFYANSAHAATLRGNEDSILADVSTTLTFLITSTASVIGVLAWVTSLYEAKRMQGANAGVEKQARSLRIGVLASIGFFFPTFLLLGILRTFEVISGFLAILHYLIFGLWALAVVFVFVAHLIKLSRWAKGVSRRSPQLRKYKKIYSKSVFLVVSLISILLFIAFFVITNSLKMRAWANYGVNAVGHFFFILFNLFYGLFLAEHFRFKKKLFGYYDAFKNINNEEIRFDNDDGNGDPNATRSIRQSSIESQTNAASTGTELEDHLSDSDDNEDGDDDDSLSEEMVAGSSLSSAMEEVIEEDEEEEDSPNSSQLSNSSSLSSS